jgi:hypothetical protein
MNRSLAVRAAGVLSLALAACAPAKDMRTYHVTQAPEPPTVTATGDAEIKVLK